MRILHTADLHLDSPFDFLSPDKAQLRRSELRGILRKLAKLVKERDIQLVLIAGDILDGDTYKDTELALSDFFHDIGVPVFIAPGNHDYLDKDSLFVNMELPDNVHVFTGDGLQLVEMPELGVRVWGEGFISRNSGPLLTGFTADKKPGIQDIMVIHGDPLVRNSIYNPVSEAEISGSGMDYIAFGHQHTFSGLRRAGNTYYAVPGCPEGRGFDETGDKGVIVADLTATGCELEFVPICERRFQIVELDIAFSDDVAEFVMIKMPGDITRDIYRLLLTGETETPPPLKLLREKLADHFFYIQLVDKTRPFTDIWQFAGDSTLYGLFLKKLKDRYNAAETDDERKLIASSARWGRRAAYNMDEGYGT